MKLNLRALCLASSIAALVCVAGTAHADGYVTGSVWEGATSYINTSTPFSTTIPPSSYTSTGTFTIVNFGGNDFSFYSGTDGSLSGFLTSGGTSVFGFTSSDGASLSDGINNDIFQFTGQTILTAGTTYSITHDDGMYLYLTGNGLTNSLVINSGDPTAADASTFTVATTGLYSFDLLYAEVNGPPATLSGNLGDIVPTPEPSSFLLLGTGLLAAAGLVRRRLTA